MSFAVLGEEYIRGTVVGEVPDEPRRSSFRGSRDDSSAHVPRFPTKHDGGIIEYGGGDDEAEVVQREQLATDGDTEQQEKPEVEQAETEKPPQPTLDRLFFGKHDLAEGVEALRVGDQVRFVVGTSRANPKHKKATQITVIQRAVEQRDQGIVISLKDNFGFLDWGEKGNELYFLLADVDSEQAIRKGTELEFTVLKHRSRQRAVRLKPLPAGNCP